MRRLLLVLAAILALLLAALAFALLVGIRVSLGPLRGEIQAAVSRAIGREVAVEGPIEIVPSLWPTFEIGDLRVANPPGWHAGGSLFTARRARLRAAVLPLWRGDIRVLELMADGVELTLTRDASGQPNWRLAPPESDEAATDPETPEPPVAEPMVLRFLGIDEVTLSHLKLSYDDRVLPPLHFEVDRADGALTSDRDLSFVMAGRWVGEPYTLWISGGPAGEIFASERSWPLAIRLEMAGTTIGLRTRLDAHREDAGPADARGGVVLERAKLDLEVKGERLDHLDRALGVSLPPLGPYELAATAAFEPERVSLDDLLLEVGSSELRGGASYALAEPRPRLDVELTSALVQLDDFAAVGWSPETGGEGREAAPARPAADALAGQARLRPLLDPEVMRSLDARVAVRVERVRSGRDRLGAGRLVATLRDGRLVVEPRVEVPGGGLDAAFVYRPRRRDVDLETRIDIEQFDYGVLLRRLAPESGMKGLLSMHVDLRSRAPRVDRGLQHASGTIGLAVWPEELKAGVVDLWAVNLVAALLPAFGGKEKSEVHCLAARFDMEDGVMRSRTLQLDTSQLRIAGQGTVDFRSKELEFRFSPSPKQPQFFNLATPIQVSGSFADFGIGTRPGALLGTLVRFLGSVVVVPVETLFGVYDDLDDEAACVAAGGTRQAGKQR